MAYLMCGRPAQAGFRERAGGSSGGKSPNDGLPPAGWRANFYPTGLNDSVVASAYEPSVPL